MQIKEDKSPLAVLVAAFKVAIEQNKGEGWIQKNEISDALIFDFLTQCALNKHLRHLDKVNEFQRLEDTFMGYLASLTMAIPPEFEKTFQEKLKDILA